MDTVREKYLFSPRKKKILLFLRAGIELSATRSVKKQLRILHFARHEWSTIDQRYLSAVIREFKRDRLIDYREYGDGMVHIVLTKKGIHRTLIYKVGEMQISIPSKWDGKWRIVMFDIPEKLRKGRDALREKLRRLHFEELQKSIWVYPYPCEDEIDFVVEFFGLRKYVRLGELTVLTLEEELLKKFKLHKPNFVKK